MTCNMIEFELLNLAHTMPSFRPWTFACAESQVLQQTMQPSGKALEELTLKIDEYGRIYIYYCAEVLSKDVGQVQKLYLCPTMHPVA
jgi:hypothetical protein